MRGHAVTLGFGVLSVILHLIMWWHYTRMDRKRAVGAEDHLMEGMSEEEINELGDQSPRFVYTV